MPVDVDLAAVEREVLTWDLSGRAVRETGAQVVDDGYAPRIVLAVARGGLLPAGAVARALDVTTVVTMDVEPCTGVDERRPVPVVLPPVLSAVDLASARVVVVDDVADTGETLRLVLDPCAGHVAQVRALVLCARPRSLVAPEHRPPVSGRAVLVIPSPARYRPPDGAAPARRASQ